MLGLERIAFSDQEQFSFHLCLVIPAVSLTPASVSAGIFLLPHRVMESFQQPSPLALEQITCRVAFVGLGVQAAPARPLLAGNYRQRRWGLRAAMTLPPPACLRFPGAGEREESLPSSSGPKSSHCVFPAQLSPALPDLQAEQDKVSGTPERG